MGLLLALVMVFAQSAIAAPGDRGSGLTPELTTWDVARPGPPARRGRAF